MKNKQTFTSGLPSTTFLESLGIEPIFRIAKPSDVPLRPLEIPYSIRNRHIHIVGKPGYGKSSLLTWLSFNDIRFNLGGVCVIDPKGDLVDRLLRVIPDDRMTDVIYVDIQDPPPMDFMSHTPGNEEMIVADLKYILMAGNPDTGNMPTLSSNIENLIYTLLSVNCNPETPAEKRCTFLDIAEFFEDEARRAFILDHVMDHRLRRCWGKSEPIPRADQARILSRINHFVRNKTLRKIFGEPNPVLRMTDVINQNKILLVKVPINHPSSSIFGALLISQIRQATFIQSRLEKSTKPFFLHIDEFHEFRATEDMDRFLQMSRGYNLCMVLANPQVSLIQDVRVQKALSGISSFIVFKISDEDTSFYHSKIASADPAKEIKEMYEKERLKYELTEPGSVTENQRYRLQRLRERCEKFPSSPVTILDALNLPKYRAIFKIDDAPSVIENSPPPMSDTPSEVELDRMNMIIANSKELYYRKAQIGQKRSVDNAPCISAPVRQDVDNGNGTPTKRRALKRDPEGEGPGISTDEG